MCCVKVMQVTVRQNCNFASFGGCFVKPDFRACLVWLDRFDWLGLVQSSLCKWASLEFGLWLSFGLILWAFFWACVMG